MKKLLIAGILCLLGIAGLPAFAQHQIDSVFILVDFVCGQAPKKAGLKIPDSTFLIFALHEPLQHMIFQRILSSGGSHALHLLLYFGLPVIIILIVSGIGRMLKRIAPRFWAFLTGGR